MRRLLVVTCLAVTATCLFPDPLAAELPPDTTFEKRQKQVLQKIAERYNGTPPDQSCFDFGASAIGLVAKLELGERGLSGGLSVSEATDRIDNIADRAINWAGECHSRCTWGEAGSPGTMHGLLALGMILHRYESQLPQHVIETIEEAAGGWWRSDSWTECPTDGDDDGTESPVGKWLVNGNISIVAGRLLAGEQMGYDSEVWNDGLEDFNNIYETAITHGGLEMNAPIYTAYQFAALVPMLELDHDETRQKARILLDYLFLVHAHLYLPGGGLGAPQARDYGGGAYDAYPSSADKVLWFYTGDEPFSADRNVHVIGAAVDYQLPEAIRSIFLNKQGGYEFKTRTPAPGVDIHGGGYDVGTPEPVAPWQAVATPDAMFGVSHGFRYQAIHVSMGVYARTRPRTFPILYQYQPYVDGDDPWLPTTSGDGNPDDFEREMFDFQRMVHRRAMISLWDPREASKPADAVRQHEDTRVHIPAYGEVGGKMRRTGPGGWYVGKAGDSYVAYHPLGDIDHGPERRNSRFSGAGLDGSNDYFYLRLDGRSGGIVELATTDQFATIDDYVADLEQRHLEFSKGDPMYAEFDALDPNTGQTERIRLEYDPERHVVDGQPRHLPDSIDDGLIDSPFVEVDQQDQTMTVERGCHPRMVYDLADATVEKQPADGPTCIGDPLETTVFSEVPYYGDFANYEPEHPDRWHVVDPDDERRLVLAPYDFQKEGDRLGEVAPVVDRHLEDFRVRLRAKTNEDLSRTDAADYAVVFGYQDHDNYYFMLANAHEDYSELFVLEDGERTQLGRATSPMIPDEQWHDLEIRREGADIEIVWDDQTVITATDETYRSGRVGVGTLNDSALFDDIAVTTPQMEGDVADVGSKDTGGGDTSYTPLPSPEDTGSGEGNSGKDGGSPADATDPTGNSGCHCRASGGSGPGPLGWALVGLLLVGLVRRHASRDASI